VLERYEYNSGLEFIIIKFGHSFLALKIGIAEWIENFLASYDAEETTSLLFPEDIINGLPRNFGSMIVAAEAKNESISICNIIFTNIL